VDELKFFLSAFPHTDVGNQALENDLNPPRKLGHALKLEAYRVTLPLPSHMPKAPEVSPPTLAATQADISADLPEELLTELLSELSTQPKLAAIVKALKDPSVSPVKDRYQLSRQ
jgi:hypothetical protein